MLGLRRMKREAGRKEGRKDGGKTRKVMRAESNTSTMHSVIK